MENCRIHSRRIFDKRINNTVAIAGVILLSALGTTGTLHVESVPPAAVTPTPLAALAGCVAPNEKYTFNAVSDVSAWRIAGAKGYESDAEHTWFYGQMHVLKDGVWSPVNVYEMHNGDVLCLPQQKSKQSGLEIEKTPIIGVTPTLTTTLQPHGTVTPTPTAETNKNSPPAQDNTVVGLIVVGAIFAFIWLGHKSRG